MAFNWQTFKTRTLTAAVFVVVMLAGLLINQWTFLILFSVIHFGCWWEYLKLVENIHQTRFHKYFKLGLMLIGYGLMTWSCRSEFQITGYELQGNLSLLASTTRFVLLAIGIFQKNKIELKSFGSGSFGLLYISLSMGLMTELFGKAIIRLHDTSLIMTTPYFYPALIIASLWVDDTMAYIIGSLIGKTQMSKISPKKTWEGTIAGVILSAVVIFLLSYYAFHFGIISYALATVAIIASIMGTVGDLFESKLKRMANVKDSGHIMPGHGGFLDRFDSLLLATPFVWLYVYFFMK